MPATLEANPFADLIPQAPTDYGQFSDLVPSGLKAGASIAGQEDYGLFADLVPKSPTSETEKVVADTPIMSEFHKNFQAAEKFVSTSTGIPFHESMNALRSLSAGAGKYIFEGLEGFEQNRAKILANPPSELTKLQGDEMILPDGSIMSKEQQDALEQRYHDAAIAQIPDAKAKADYFKQVAENADTSQYVDPELAKTIPARIAHAAGSAGVMAVESMIPFAGIPFMVMHGAMATEAEAKNAGKTDAEAEAAGVRSAIGLALFGGASKLAALGVAKLLPDGASSVRTFLTQFVGQEAANETSSRAINAWESAADAPEGKKIEAALNALKDTTLEQSTLNTVYALAHASKAAERAPVRPEAAPEPSVPLKATEIPPATIGEPIEQAPATEVLKSPKIVAAAIQEADTGKIFSGPSHPQIYDKFPQIEGDPGDAFTGEGWNTGGNYVDGFVDQNGKFYDREEAAALVGLPHEASMGELEAVAGKISDKAPYKIIKPSVQAGTENQGAAATGESNALQIRSSETQIPRPIETGQDQPISSEGMGRSEQGTETAGAPQAQKEPIGVADAIAEIQRRNAPIPLGEHGVSRAAREAASEVDVTSAGHNSAEAHVERGNKLISAGAIPDEMVQDAISRNAWSSNAVDAAIAKDAALTEKARSARRAADADPSMEGAAVEAEKAAQTWEDTAIRPIRGQFHETGMALQSARNLDTGDYIDYSKTFVDKNGRAPDAKEETVLQKATRKIRDLNAADARELNQLDRTGGRPRKSLDPKRLREELAALKEKMLADCLL